MSELAEEALSTVATNQGSVTFLIPTLNPRYLRRCLESIKRQEYPTKLIEILVVDGGSNDETTETAGQFGAIVVDNPLRTTEAARAIGTRLARGEFLVFLDSDNELIGNHWVETMLRPFKDERVVACEPLFWDSDSGDLTAIDRYCALLGMNDPLNLFLGNYSHYSNLTGRWTDLPISWIECDGYLEIQPPTNDKEVLPTLGSNGCTFRTRILRQRPSGDYLFHLDLVQALWLDRSLRIARAPVSVAHYYADSLRTYVKKATRNVEDHYFFRETGVRTYPYDALGFRGVVMFVVFSVLLIPTIAQAIRGYRHRPDSAWWLHPICCFLVAGTYGRETLRLKLRRDRARPFDRDQVKW